MNIAITNESDDSSTATSSIQARVGLSTHVVLDKYSVKTQPRPYTVCVDNLIAVNSYKSICYQKTFIANQALGRRYHQSDCSFMCMEKMMGDNCGR